MAANQGGYLLPRKISSGRGAPLSRHAGGRLRTSSRRSYHPDCRVLPPRRAAASNPRTGPVSGRGDDGAGRRQHTRSYERSIREEE